MPPSRSRTVRWCLVGLLTVGGARVLRCSPRPWLGRSVLGAIFRAAAILALDNPITFTEGVIVDMRMLPVALAGAFAGLEGTAVAMAMAIVVRIEMVGAGVAAGCVSIAGAGLGGFLWRRLDPNLGQRTAAKIASLGAMTEIPWETPLLPGEAVWPFVRTVWPVLIPLHVAGVVVAGFLVEREEELAGSERRLSRMGNRG